MNVCDVLPDSPRDGKKDGRDIAYTVQEVKVPDGYSSSISGDATKVSAKPRALSQDTKKAARNRRLEQRHYVVPGP